MLGRKVIDTVCFMEKDIRFVHRNGIYAIYCRRAKSNDIYLCMILLFPFLYIFTSGCGIYVGSFFPPLCLHVIELVSSRFFLSCFSVSKFFVYRVEVSPEGFRGTLNGAFLFPFVNKIVSTIPCNMAFLLMPSPPSFRLDRSEAVFLDTFFGFSVCLIHANFYLTAHLTVDAQQHACFLCCILQV